MFRWFFVDFGGKINFFQYEKLKKFERSPYDYLYLASNNKLS